MHQTSKNSHMKICTWNSQGNPLNDAIKLNILNHLLTIEQCNVVMIQECGQFILPARGRVKTPNINKKTRCTFLCGCTTSFCFSTKKSLINNLYGVICVK